MANTPSKSPVTSVKDVESDSVVTNALPDGTYEGQQSGYCLRFAIGDKQYEAQTTLGVRGLDCPCKVKIAAGVITDIVFE